MGERGRARAGLAFKLYGLGILLTHRFCVSLLYIYKTFMSRVQKLCRVISSVYLSLHK